MTDDALREHVTSIAADLHVNRGFSRELAFQAVKNDMPQLGDTFIAECVSAGFQNAERNGGKR